MKWTAEQRKVIDTRNKNILVAAAAGSGKTAVLVERIISMISEGENPIDIDHILVVTFTNAAAAQMRSRIGKALDAKLQEKPDNKHIQKQVSLLQSANITTIHSFCLNVIRNYFHHIDLDPSFKLADESEITLMKSDVMAEVLEKWYEEGTEEFHEFVEAYSRSKSDLSIEEIVLQLYQFSMSNPWPSAWMDGVLKFFEIQGLEEMESSSWMDELYQYVEYVLADLKEKNRRALQLCQDFDGPEAYLDAILADREILNRIYEAKSYSQKSVAFQDIAYARLSNKKQADVSIEKKELVKSLREDVKDGIKKLKEQFFFQAVEDMVSDLQNVSKVMKVLMELTKDFMDHFALKKEEKNLIDFNDLEHLALKILIEEVDGEKVPTKAAQELSELFEEILIDEYQDSNLVQETLLQSISRERLGKPNRFMVGDVKQSIYKFRLAMPELFMDKYNHYSISDMDENGNANLYQRIDLDKNFRSRQVVLTGVNKIFHQIMKSTVGGITYDEAAALKYGELFEETLEEALEQKTESEGNQDSTVMVDITGVELTEKQEDIEDNLQECIQEKQDDRLIDKKTQAISLRERIAKDVELILVTESKDDNNSKRYENISEDDTEDMGSEEEILYNKIELEARAIAKRIKELIDPENGLAIFENQEHRPAKLKDIVILLRSMTNYSEVFINTLMQEGIPAYADTSTGYFQTVEIMTVLNMLRIIDNPRQDIPLTGVMYSPMFGFTSTELAKVRVTSRKTSMYQALLLYTQEEEGKDRVLYEKCVKFLDTLHDLREKTQFIAIHELIEEVLSTTGYSYYVLTLPGGDRRKANIDMLIHRAIQYEKGSYSGLFNFIRYIEKLEKYNVDFGEASTSGEQDNTVRIMTIHKSKGLEFPVVFVAGLSKNFNQQDVRSSIVIHSQYGVGPDYIDYKNRTKVPTLLKKVIQRKMTVENLGEELRVLYVAMTRAREKLILTGYIEAGKEIKGKEFCYYDLISAKSYMDYVLPSVVNQIPQMPDVLDESMVVEQDQYKIRVIHKAQIVQGEIARQVFVRADQIELDKLTADIVYDEEIRRNLQSRLEYTYPYEGSTGLKVKMTVSELKRMGQRLEEEESEPLIPWNKAELIDEDRTIPNFIRGTQDEITPMEKGVLYHKVLELLDLSVIRNRADVMKALQEMVQNNHIKESDRYRLNNNHIIKFVQSDLADRMRKAQERNQLHREKQFVIGIPASELIEGKQEEELVLVQGIIDTFFEEEDGIVLVDYKSDYVESEEDLLRRYEVQLMYYRRAIEQIMKKQVKETIIYSLHLGKEIEC